MAVADGKGLTGIKPAGEVELGTIVVPDDPTLEPITAGDDADIDPDELDPESGSRLDDAGVPVGVGNFGKGEDSLLADPQDAGNGADADEDGLVDLFDADDDGNGVVDDFEEGASNWAMPPDSDVRANFFMNLKIPVENSSVYYSGTADQIAAALSQHTIITFECMTEPFATRSIVSAHLLASPAPAYLGGAMVMPRSWDSSQLWSITDYAFTFREDRFEAFVVPNAVMPAGDTFTVEIAMSDGSTITTSRMLNYIFKRIPRLVKYGSAGALQAFDPATPAGNGSLGQPVTFDGSQDLVAEFAPPEDENGDLLVNLDYALDVFFYGDNGFPINDIDVAATWPTPVPGMRPGSLAFDVPASALTVTPDNTYTITIPKELFVDQVVLKDGSTAQAGIYKIDIAAQCPSGNAAIMFALTKQ
jgi:hypothetical protein